MINRFIKTVSLPVVLVFAACGGNEQETMHTPSVQDVIAEEGFTEEGIITGEYRRYKGTIANQPVTVNISINNQQNYERVEGKYYYDKIGVNISLYMSEDTTLDDGEISLTEYSPDRNVEEPARWRVRFSGDSLVGTWENWSNEKTYPIILQEDYNGSVQNFSLVSIVDSAKYADTIEPKAEYSCSILIPVGNDEKGSFIRSVIYSSMGCDTVGLNGFAGCLEDKKKAYFKDYLSQFEQEDLDAEDLFYYRWNMSVTYNVVYNDNDIVVIDKGIYEYTGGAHGNYGSDYLNIDRANKKLWKLSDIMQVDTARIVPMLEAQIRKDFLIEKGEPLNTRLLDDEVEIPASFYISNKGITFVYGLYEIASYADGMVNVFIPYNKLMNLLKPEFKQRMGLEAIAANK